MSVHVEPQAVTAKMAAKFLDISEPRLCQLRKAGTGPKWRRVLGRIVYETADLKAWQAGRDGERLRQANLNKLRLLSRDLAKLAADLAAVTESLAE